MQRRTTAASQAEPPSRVQASRGRMPAPARAAAAAAAAATMLAAALLGCAPPAASAAAGGSLSLGARRRMPTIRQQHPEPPPGGGSPRPSSADCTWKYYTQPLSHFAEGATVGGNATYQQRVCVVDKYWRPAAPSLSGASESAAAAAPPPKGPILFYTGNEVRSKTRTRDTGSSCACLPSNRCPGFVFWAAQSPVEEYVNNTGLMWELAPKLGALLVFAEHRYEGESFPHLVGMPDCMAHCTSAEALADFAALIGVMKAELDCAASPVVAFGGSYGGMLSSWFRIKYSNVVAGAVAASAPIWGLPLTYPAGEAQPARLIDDGSAVAVARGVSAAGGATDFCHDNMLGAWCVSTVQASFNPGRTP
eukprot:SAG22_NODE_3_length_48349_cov_158.681180_22_plen_364_part_00